MLKSRKQRTLRGRILFLAAALFLLNCSKPTAIEKMETHAAPPSESKNDKPKTAQLASRDTYPVGELRGMNDESVRLAVWVFDVHPEKQYQLHWEWSETGGENYISFEEMPVMMDALRQLTKHYQSVKRGPSGDAYREWRSSTGLILCMMQRKTKQYFTLWLKRDVSDAQKGDVIVMHPDQLDKLKKISLQAMEKMKSLGAK